MFQFHTGSIKSAVERLNNTLWHSFNSILVRLKAASCSLHRKSYVLSFNSILVRLKAERVKKYPHENEVSIPYWFD